MPKIIKLIISIMIPLTSGFLGSIFTGMSVKTWYLNINKPLFNPPGWIFAPVWTVLFILIGISFYICWNNDFGTNKKICLTVYFLQILFNFLWSLFFFGMRNPLFGLIDILILWLFIIANMILFYNVSKIAGYLLIPYFLWVSFATILNFSILLLN